MTIFTAWNGETYPKLTEALDAIKEHPDLEHLDQDEQLRLALWLRNNNYGVIDLDLVAEAETEQEIYAGEFYSEADFVENLLEEAVALPADLPDWVKIDYQGTWDSALRYDYHYYDIIDQDGNYRKFFWRNY